MDRGQNSSHLCYINVVSSHISYYPLGLKKKKKRKSSVARAKARTAFKAGGYRECHG